MIKKNSVSGRIAVIILTIIVFLSVAIIGTATASAASTDSSVQTLYFSPNGYWSNLFAVYAWQDADYDNGEWTSLSKVSGVDGLYTVDIADSCNKVIFCSRTSPSFSWDAVNFKTDELTIPDGSNHLTLTGNSSSVWSYYSDTENPITDSTVYFKPCEEWMDIQSSSFHEFALHAYNESTAKELWVQMTLTEGEFGTYPTVWSAQLPDGYTTVEFCRVEGSVDSDDYTVWEATDELTVPADSNLFTQYDTISDGTWGTYVPSEGGNTDTPDPEDPTEPDNPSDDDIITDTDKVYFTPNDTWLGYVNDSIGSISVCTWETGSNEVTWGWMTVTEISDNVYYADIPASHDNILFGMCFSSSPDVIWARTDNQLIPDDSNHFTQDADGSSGTWSVYDISATTYYSVCFVDDDGKLIKAQVVAEGTAATAPTAPAKSSDPQYTYTFIGWDKAFDNITEDTIVTAQYSKALRSYTVTFKGQGGTVIDTMTVNYGESATAPTAPTVDGYTFKGWDTDFGTITGDTVVNAQYTKVTTPATVGNLKIDVVAGRGFLMSVDGGASRAQGPSYYNTSAPVGVKVTVTSVASDGNAFVGWINPANGFILSTSETYSFYTSGNDTIKAVYKIDFPTIKMVTFMHDKASQQWDVQYYSAGDSILFPSVAPQILGYEFKGWNMTEAEIQAEIAKGNDVTVLPVWEKVLTYVDVTINGGTAEGTQNDKGQFLMGEAITVTANPAESGKKFAYWTDASGNVKSYNETYTFFLAGPTTLTAVFVSESEEIDYQVLLSVDNFTPGDYGTFTVTWFVPDKYEFVGGGIIAVNKDNYNESTFVHGSTDTNVWDRTGSDTLADNTFNWTGPVYSGQTWYAKCWAQYKDESGTVQTVYSDMFTAVKD